MPTLVTVPGYRIEELLSWGSQGDVFRGIDGSGGTVALKIVTADRAEGHAHARERLHREARLLASIDSPHIVKVREFLQTAEWSCLVLEFLRGQRLDVEVRERAGTGDSTMAIAARSTVVMPAGAAVAPSPPVAGGRGLARASPTLQTTEYLAWASDVVLQLASGLADLHRNGLVHRDVKPQNVMLADGRVVIIDFGFARRDGVTTLTRDGSAIGTLAYMSPELLSGHEADERSDVYSLGATLFQVFTGQPPFGNRVGHVNEIASRSRARSVRWSNPAVSRGVATVLARCLEPDPRDRYANAGEVLADLRRVQQGKGARVPFSVGRVWRHHRRLLRYLVAALVLAMGCAFALSRTTADDIAGAILAQHEAHPEAVPAAWRDCRDELRPAVVDHLNHRLVGEPERGYALARRLSLGVLRLDARAGHRVAVAPASPGAQPPTLSTAQWRTADVPQSLLLPPGLIWCFVMSTDPAHWWSPDDPFCIQALLRLGGAGAAEPLRSLAVLPTATGRLAKMATLRVDAGSHDALGDDQVVRRQLDSAFAVAPREVSVADVAVMRMQLQGSEGRRELDAWLRHPDEPDGIGDELWSVWGRKEQDVKDKQPAMLSFWEAHRLATWCGGRLPVSLEWQVVAVNDGAVLGTPEQRRVPGSLSSVDAEPDWDRTSRGVCFANSNAREWTLELRSGGTQIRYFAAPGTRAVGNRPLEFATNATVGGGQLARGAAGFRIYRSLLGVSPR